MFSRRAFVTGAVGLAAARYSRAEGGPFQLEESTIDAITESMKAGRVTSFGLTRAFLARIEEIDRSGPALRSILQLNANAERDAARLDEERARGKIRGPLHGVPITLKDNFDTTEMDTSSGSLALLDTRPTRDAFVVARLRAAGAVVLGKNNLSEWGNLRGSPSLSGWSARGGRCKNPYALDRSPDGSSSGSAVAVSANLCVASVGSETDGSIVGPAACNGVVGIKPTVGLLSRTGVIHAGTPQDTPGPLARTVRDAALLLEVMCAPDPADPTTKAARFSTKGVFTGRRLDGVRLGVLREVFTPLAAVALDRVFDRALGALTATGATIVDGLKLQASTDGYVDYLLASFRKSVEGYLGARGGACRTVADLVAFNRMHPEELAFFGQERFERALLVPDVDGPEMTRVRARLLKEWRDDGVDRLIREHKLDGLVMPTSDPAGVVDDVLGDFPYGNSSSVAAIPGYPAVTVPMGFVRGLPVGMTFVGPAFSDARMIRYAYLFEQATSARRPPRCSEHADPPAP